MSSATSLRSKRKVVANCFDRQKGRGAGPLAIPSLIPEDLVLSPEKEATPWFIKTKALDQ